MLERRGLLTELCGDVAATLASADLSSKCNTLISWQLLDAWVSDDHRAEFYLWQCRRQSGGSYSSLKA